MAPQLRNCCASSGPWGAWGIPYSSPQSRFLKPGGADALNYVTPELKGSWKPPTAIKLRVRVRRYAHVRQSQEVGGNLAGVSVLISALNVALYETNMGMSHKNF